MSEKCDNVQALFPQIRRKLDDGVDEDPKKCSGAEQPRQKVQQIPAMFPCILMQINIGFHSDIPAEDMRPPRKRASGLPAKVDLVIDFPPIDSLPDDDPAMCLAVPRKELVAPCRVVWRDGNPDLLTFTGTLVHWCRGPHGNSILDIPRPIRSHVEGRIYCLARGAVGKE